MNDYSRLNEWEWFSRLKRREKQRRKNKLVVDAMFMVGCVIIGYWLL